MSDVYLKGSAGKSPESRGIAGIGTSTTETQFEKAILAIEVLSRNRFLAVPIPCDPGDFC
jgi:hypothetical protein